MGKPQNCSQSPLLSCDGKPREGPAGNGQTCGFALVRTLPITLVDTTSVMPTSTSSTALLTCAELAQQIERLQPNAAPQDIARLCLLLTNSAEDIDALRDPRALGDAWKRTGLKLQVATDQHAAMTEELEALAASDPKSFSQDQIWILIRAIKVQSQILQMYVGHSLLDV